MGANGSKGKGLLEDPSTRNYHTALDISDNIKVIEANNSKAKVKPPEESHTPNRIYVAINKPATDKIGKKDPYAGKLKSIAVYGSDCKKLFEIHVDHAHNGLTEHYHPWKDGHPVKAGTGKNSPNVAYPLTQEMKKLLNQVKIEVPHA